MQVNQNVKIHNRFDIEVRDGVTGELKKEAVAYNIVLDQMYTRLCGGDSYFVNIHFGTGTGTTVATRTTLFAYLGTKVATTEETIKAVPVSKWKQKIVLNPEEFVGSTITEVGIAWSSATTSLITHALLKDSEGMPISITKTATDVVTIYATVFITFTNSAPEFILLGIPNNNQLINYLLGASGPAGSFGLLPGENYGPRLGSTATAIWTSDTVAKQRKTNIPRFGITVANGHAKALEFSNLFSISIPSAGVFMGQTYDSVSLGVGDGNAREFILPSRNVNQGSVIIKLDGILTADYVMSEINPFINFKINNPEVLPTGGGHGVALTPDGAIMAVAHYTTPYITTYDGKPRTTKITFNTAPPVEAVITADYTVDGIHKTDQYVVDASFAIQFGEGI